MIEFNSQNEFILENEVAIANWILETAKSEGFEIGELGFVFCTDNFLWDINQKYLNHDTFTDIITFDYKEGNTLQGEIYISTERVEENAKNFEVPFYTELKRVIIHGVLHMCGYGDIGEEQQASMRKKENEYIQSFNS